jgi:hypothetical protein
MARQRTGGKPKVSDGNRGAHDLVDREGLMDSALSAQVSLVTSKEEREPKDVEWLRRLRDLLLARVDELHASQQARTLVEKRYLWRSATSMVMTRSSPTWHL